MPFQKPWDAERICIRLIDKAMRGASLEWQLQSVQDVWCLK